MSEFTILERALTAFQKFYGILSNVEWLLSRRAEGHETRDGVNSEAETSLFNGALDSFIDIFADMCSRIEKHVKQVKKNEIIGQVDAIRFVQVGAFRVWDGRLQGLMFYHRQQDVPVKHILLDGPYFRELLEKELGGEGIAGSISPQKLRGTVKSLRRLFSAGPSR
ncbi:hypothetical protein SCAR479_09941 [Seiridium cardinale]|uniref:Uncharacterized protein n=1 Tax=Seiridium cardinale TaxID=138064 RepID=A0ABR2XHW1_9PEZI